MNLKDLLKKYADLVAEQKGILDKGDAISADELTRAEAINPELDTMDAEIKRLEDLDKTRQKNAERQKHLNTVERPEFPVADAKNAPPAADPARPAVVSLSGRRVSAFKGADPALQAYRFGQFFLASVVGKQSARDYCRKNGIALTKGQVEGDDARGGFLVPEEFESALIDLREEYGVFRKFAKLSPMRSDTKSIPRRTGGLTGYAVGEGQPIPESQKAWDSVKLTAKKFAVLAKYTNELSEDAIIDIGDDLAGEISYAFSQIEDDAGFNGDGTKVYNGIVGARTRLKNLSATIGNIGGLVVASGNTWDEFTLPDFNKVKGRLPKYARTKNTRWFCSQAFYHDVMEALMLKSGGVTAAELAAGRPQEFFMGYPVEISQVLPDQEANSDIPCLFGDLSLAALFGDRRETTLAMSEHYAFETDELAIRGTERFDINVHDVGTASATSNLRKAGPIVGLISASS